MKWNKRDVVPPLGRSAIEHGNTNGGLSIALIFKHESGLFSSGKVLIHAGNAVLFYAGQFEDDVHSPSLDERDHVIEWCACPTPEEIVEAFEAIERL